MYSIRTTPGFIVSSKPYGEAGKIISIFTRDLGLVLATAQGIRFEKSKLRYHTKDYSFGTFSFVRGKEFWKLTNAGVEAKEIRGWRLEVRRSQQLMARIALLLKRLLHGEDPHPELFECLENCETFLKSNEEINEEEIKSLESLVVLRMLHALGYIGNDIQIKEFVGTNLITKETLQTCLAVRTIMNQHINKALKESQM